MRPDQAQGVEPAVVQALDGVDPHDSWAMLELLTFDQDLGDLPGLSEALPIHLADLAGRRLGPYTPSAAFGFLARLDPGGARAVTMSGDGVTFRRPSEVVALLGSKPIPNAWGPPQPARPVAQLGTALASERPTGGLVVRDGRGRMIRAIEVLEGQLVRDLGLPPELASHARLLSSSVFVKEGLVTDAHTAIVRGEPLASLTSPARFAAYEKARSIVMRRWAADVVDTPDGTFAFVNRVAVTRDP